MRAVKIGDTWHWHAACQCGWQYQRLGVEWEFAVSIASAHTYLKGVQ
ncbi:hypothetical protein [Streptomyces omiyaensis]